MTPSQLILSVVESLAINPSEMVWDRSITRAYRWDVTENHGIPPGTTCLVSAMLGAWGVSGTFYPTVTKAVYARDAIGACRGVQNSDYSSDICFVVSDLTSASELSLKTASQITRYVISSRCRSRSHLTSRTWATASHRQIASEHWPSQWCTVDRCTGKALVGIDVATQQTACETTCPAQKTCSRLADLLASSLQGAAEFSQVHSPPQRVRPW